MLKLIIEMLRYQKIGVSENVDIAKGKYKFPENFEELKNYNQWRLQK